MAASVARNGLKLLCGVVIVAALATTSTAKAGLIGTGQASFCDPTAAQVFAPWSDSSSYASLFNGGFESGSLGWGLSGGARVVSGNEPFYVESSHDSHSLLLPSGQLGDERHGVLRHRRLAPAPLRQEHRFADGVIARPGRRPEPPRRPALGAGRRHHQRRRRLGAVAAPRAPALQRHRPARARRRSRSASPRAARALPSRSTTSIWIPGKTAEPAPSLDSGRWSARCPSPSGLAAPSG